MFPFFRGALLRTSIVGAAVMVSALTVIIGPVYAQALTLTDAFARAIAADPSLPAADALVEAAEASMRQAGVRPNPRIALTAENFLGTGVTQGLGRLETTVLYEQLLERGGKLEARTSVAQAGLEIAELLRYQRALDLLEKVEIAWVDALAAQASVELNETRLLMAQRLQTETDRRVAAARDPAFAAARVAALIAETQTSLTRAHNDSTTARSLLSAYWDGSPDFELDLVWLTNIADYAATLSDEDTIDLAILRAQAQRASAQIGYEEAYSVQDPTFQGGLRHFGQDSDVAFVAGVSIPLPLYNDNSANVARASAEHSAAQRDYFAARRNLQRETTHLQARIAASNAEASSLATTAIPEAERAVALSRDGFNRGAFGYIDIIEAERQLAAVQERRLLVLRATRIDIARHNRLMGHYETLLFAQETR